ncbi:DUF6518 family protein [Terrabacter sp. LjRoot27]|uniref:hypothetical protein n=1 Tax=Terrabacter sp. LjRoot27 TaxID=3342306 RepID=UPI003ECE8533
MNAVVGRRVLVAAVLLGAGSVLLGALASGYGPLSLRPDPGLPWLRVVSTFMGAPWAWALFGLVLGYAVPTVRASALTATGGLLVAVLAWYLAKAAVGITPWLEWDAIALWSAAAILAGPVLGLLGHLARRPTWTALPAALVAPALMVVDARRTSGVGGLSTSDTRALVYGAAVGLALALVARVALAGRNGLDHEGRRAPS